LEKNLMTHPYNRHLRSSDDLITTYEATRAGFISLALEKNRRATRFVAAARALQEAALQAKNPNDLLNIPNITTGLLTAAGLSDKALTHLLPEDKIKAIKELITNFLEPAGEKFVEELIYRYLLTRGDALGGSMRNIGGALAQRKLTRAILSSMMIAGIKYKWQDAKTRKWILMNTDDTEIENGLKGLHWQNEKGNRSLLFNLKVPQVKNNVDLCLFNLSPEEINKSKYKLPESYIAFGELKGGIDPAGADEHWKTARTAVRRIREAFSSVRRSPLTFYVGTAIEKKMAGEIWEELKLGILANAANLNDEKQMASIASWLCSI
jgi:hypothetical protein